MKNSFGIKKEKGQPDSQLKASMNAAGSIFPPQPHGPTEKAGKDAKPKLTYTTVAHSRPARPAMARCREATSHTNKYLPPLLLLVLIGSNFADRVL